MATVKTLLNGFYSKAAGDTMADGELLLWHDVLAPLPTDDIYEAILIYQRKGPRTAKGKLTKPAPGDIYEIAAQIAHKRALAKRGSQTPTSPINAADAPKLGHQRPTNQISDAERQEVLNTLKSFGITQNPFKSRKSEEKDRAR